MAVCSLKLIDGTDDGRRAACVRDLADEYPPPPPLRAGATSISVSEVNGEKERINGGAKKEAFQNFLHPFSLSQDPCM